MNVLTESIAPAMDENLRELLFGLLFIAGVSSLLFCIAIGVPLFRELSAKNLEDRFQQQIHHKYGLLLGEDDVWNLRNNDEDHNFREVQLPDKSTKVVKLRNPKSRLQFTLVDLTGKEISRAVSYD